MTLHPQHEFSIPEETARVARAAYPKGNIYKSQRLSPMRHPHHQTGP